MVKKIISGGQTGPDRAALNFALHYGLECGGWCPKGRIAKDGIIPSKYPLSETNTSIYSERTIKNIEEAEATLIILLDHQIDAGTALTLETCQKLKKPCITVSLQENDMHDHINNTKHWLSQHNIKILNVAGPRESNAPGIQSAAFQFLVQLFASN